MKEVAETFRPQTTRSLPEFILERREGQTSEIEGVFQPDLG
jgi:hypothetical protein